MIMMGLSVTAWRLLLSDGAIYFRKSTDGALQNVITRLKLPYSLTVLSLL